MPDPTPLPEWELAAWRRWHRPNVEGQCSLRSCGPDPWPCPVARLLATLEAGERALASKIGPDWREALPYTSVLLAIEG